MAKRNGQAKFDRHHLYEASVQSVDADLDFAAKVYERHAGRPLRLLREDFCGTAALACSWVRRRRKNRAVGVDLDGRTLDWARQHNLAALGESASRVELIQGDVCRVLRPRADVTVGLNFSYWVFSTRQALLAYFEAAHAGLREDGLLVLDLFGGSEAAVQSEEERRIPPEVCFDGTRLPSFSYCWDQAYFNPINGAFRCHIHFKLKDGTRLRKAFSYHWRFWSLPEIRDLLLEAGFKRVDAYTDDWDEDEGDSNGIYRRRKNFDNEGVWIGYAVGVK
ncbi:MAG: class I SAM-dependent methyltransferase [Planctomycetota bacterium]